MTREEAIAGAVERLATTTVFDGKGAIVACDAYDEHYAVAEDDLVAFGEALFTDPDAFSLWSANLREAGRGDTPEAAAVAAGWLTPLPDSPYYLDRETHEEEGPTPREALGARSHEVQSCLETHDFHDHATADDEICPAPDLVFILGRKAWRTDTWVWRSADGNARRVNQFEALVSDERRRLDNANAIRGLGKAWFNLDAEGIPDVSLFAPAKLDELRGALEEAGFNPEVASASKAIEAGREILCARAGDPQSWWFVEQGVTTPKHVQDMGQGIPNPRVGIDRGEATATCPACGHVASGSSPKAAERAYAAHFEAERKAGR